MSGETFLDGCRVEADAARLLATALNRGAARGYLAAEALADALADRLPLLNRPTCPNRWPAQSVEDKQTEAVRALRAVTTP